MAPAISSAHTLSLNGTYFPASNNSGCFGSVGEFGESGGGNIHLLVNTWFMQGTCSNPGNYANTSGAGLLMLLKNTGNGPLGGWAVCASWPVTQATNPGNPFNQVGRHVDTPVPCGGGEYALGFCAGPSGYSSLYWEGHSTYVRNCAGTYVNWAFSNGTHNF